MPLLLNIAMCTYNGAAYVRQQLESFAAQTRRPDELLVCDDRSTDDTMSIVRDFAAEAPFPVHMHVNEQNLGLNQNFANALNMSDGDAVFFSDQDDVWRPEKIEKFEREFVADRDVGLVFADARVVDPQLSPVGHTHWQSVDFSAALQDRVKSGGAFDVLARHCFVAGATMAVRADLKRAILPLPPTWAFDAWAAMVAASLTKTRIIAEPLNDYRQHPKQALGGAKKGFWRRYVEAKRAVDASYYIKAAEMAERLRDRLLANGVAIGDRRIAHLDQKIRFSRSRAEMRRSMLMRYPLLIRELTAGRYHKFGQGFRSVAVDALV
jgi:glycosyltransferase involved in cell wall biosynthesis